jgi:hypothetical protein
MSKDFSWNLRHGSLGKQFQVSPIGTQATIYRNSVQIFWGLDLRKVYMLGLLRAAFLLPEIL